MNVTLADIQKVNELLSKEYKSYCERIKAQPQPGNFRKFTYTEYLEFQTITTRQEIQVAKFLDERMNELLDLIPTKEKRSIPEAMEWVKAQTEAIDNQPETEAGRA